MEQNQVLTTTSVQFDEEAPYIETRARVLRSPDGSLPEGKVMVFRMPILPPGASDEEVRDSMTMEIVDDEHKDDPFYCEACARLGLTHHGLQERIERRAGRSRRPRRLGRNDPCWCGSGKKYKRCCME